MGKADSEAPPSLDPVDVRDCHVRERGKVRLPPALCEPRETDLLRFGKTGNDKNVGLHNPTFS